MAETVRPGSVTAMGIMNLLIGGFGSLCCVCGLSGVGFMVASVSNLPPPAAGEPDLKARFGEVDTAYPAFKYVMIGVPVVLILILLLLAVSGIGLLKLRPWGRTGSIVAGAALLIVLLANLGYTLAEGNAAMLKGVTVMQEMQKEMAAKNNQPPPPMMPMQNNPTASAIQNVVSTLVECTYPVLLIWIMMLPSVRAAFAGRQPGPTAAEDVDDRDRGWGDVDQ
jgi:hypothetical protein